ncbi:MAG: Zn-dependent protease [Promethearchaeota archaeon Loki_b32]|nr:MAG: Zn-dependent protease [Candidatus Lokiarchaeota archaeon Loki_b32]
MIPKYNQSNSKVFAHTYSIVARDSRTGEMGVGVQSHWFSVGSVVSWGEAGVGVVATQSLVNKSFGLRGLELLKQGKSPQEAIAILLSDDEGRDVRQVAILDAQGRVATHTGSKCIKQAGHIVGESFSVQANMMLSDKVWPVMAEAFEKNNNMLLPERIIKSLEAAESVGGDIRGKQSAALLVVAGEPTEEKWEDPIIDLRVEDHKEPLKELNRILTVYRAYEHMNKGDLAIEKGDMDNALEEYDAAQKMFPENLEMTYWVAVSLANQKKIKDALVLFENVFKKDENWRLLTERLPDSELLNVSEEEMKKILSLK